MTQIHHIAQRNTHLLVLVIVAFLMSMGSCKKDPVTPSNPHDPNTLPPLTHEGKNTFGCLVNGEVWVAYAPSSIGGTVAMEGSYTTSTGRFYLKGTKKINESNIFENVRIRCLDVYSVGEYNINVPHDQVIGFSDYNGNHNCGTYYNIESSTGTISITYFSISQGIISGTFEMNLINSSCPGDTIRITEGRFDWRMTVY